MGRQLEIEEDLLFQQRSWRVQRVGWVLMALVVIAALAGAFGGGPLSTAVAGEQGGALWVEYERFLRASSPEELRIHWGAGLADGRNLVTVWLDRRYLDGREIRYVMPQPEAVEVEPDRVVYRFAVVDPSRPASATFWSTPSGLGRAGGRIGLAGGPTVELSQLVYP